MYWVAGVDVPDGRVAAVQSLARLHCPTAGGKHTDQDGTSSTSPKPYAVLAFISLELLRVGFSPGVISWEWERGNNYRLHFSSALSWTPGSPWRRYAGPCEKVWRRQKY